MTHPLRPTFGKLRRIVLIAGGSFFVFGTTPRADPSVIVIPVSPRDGSFGLRPIPWPHHIETPREVARPSAKRSRYTLRPAAPAAAPQAAAPQAAAPPVGVAAPLPVQPSTAGTHNGGAKVEPRILNGASDVPKVTVVATPDAARERAGELLASGQIVAARSVLSDPAVQSDARVLTALAATYDPIVLAAYPNYKGAADREQAIKLYLQAAAKGDQEAVRRLAALSARPVH